MKPSWMQQMRCLRPHGTDTRTPAVHLLNCNFLLVQSGLINVLHKNLCLGAHMLGFFPIPLRCEQWAFVLYVKPPFRGVGDVAGQA